MGNEIRIRCSALPRIMACPASAQRPEIDIDTSDETAALGTAVHEALEQLIMCDKTLQLNPGDMDLFPLAEKHGCDEDELRMLTWQGWHMWEAVSDRLENVDCETKMELRFADDVILSGSADVCATAAGQPDTIVIIDWKSGRKQRDYLAQLKGYARLSVGDCSEYTSALVMVGWLRTGTLDTHAFTAAELDDFEDDLVKTATSQSRYYFPSESTCGYCPMSRECPARRALISSAGKDMQALSGDGISREIAPADLAALYPKSRLLKAALEAYESAIKAAIDDNGGKPIECDTGSVGLKDGKRTTVYFDRDIISQYVPGVDLDTMRPTIKKTDLENAVCDAAPRGKKKEAREACFDALRKAGCIEETAFRSLDYSAKA